MNNHHQQQHQPFCRRCRFPGPDVRLEGCGCYLHTVSSGLADVDVDVGGFRVRCMLYWAFPCFLQLFSWCSTNFSIQQLGANDYSLCDSSFGIFFCFLAWFWWLGACQIFPPSSFSPAFFLFEMTKPPSKQNGSMNSGTNYSAASRCL